MNTGKSGCVGRSKHRQAFGHDTVSRHVKLDLERRVNQLKKKRDIVEKMYSSISDLMNARKN